MAGALSANGISKGDRVIIYMPMIPETIVVIHQRQQLSAELREGRDFDCEPSKRGQNPRPAFLPKEIILIIYYIPLARPVRPKASFAPLRATS